MVNDPEAHSALWAAICDVASRFAGQCRVYASRTPEPGSHIRGKMQIPDVETWKLVEALSLLSVLLKADKVYCEDVTNLFGQTGPLHFVESGQDRYLWAQPSLLGEESELGGRPDLVVTTSRDTPTAVTTIRVIECKCRQHLGAPDIRAEFGKAHDLKVTSYLIWSFYTPAPKVVTGARRLGLDLVALGFDTEQRSALIENSENLVSHVANTVEWSKHENHFAAALLKSGQEVTRKMPLPR